MKLLPLQAQAWTVDSLSGYVMSGFSLMDPPHTLFLLLNIQKSPHGILVTIGCSHHQVCAYCSLVAYLKKLGFTNTFEITRPLLVLTCRKNLFKVVFVSCIKELVSSLGLGHPSFQATVLGLVLQQQQDCIPLMSRS